MSKIIPELNLFLQNSNIHLSLNVVFFSVVSLALYATNPINEAFSEVHCSKLGKCVL